MQYEALREERPELFFPAYGELSNWWQDFLDTRSADDLIARRVGRLLGREIVPGIDDLTGRPEPDSRL